MSFAEKYWQRYVYKYFDTYVNKLWSKTQIWFIQTQYILLFMFSNSLYLLWNINLHNHAVNSYVIEYMTIMCLKIN